MSKSSESSKLRSEPSKLRSEPSDPEYISTHSTLSDKAILRYREHGEIIIEPFRIENLNTSSYDVCLGDMYYREQPLQDEWVSNIYNIYSEEMVKRVWGSPIAAKPYSHYKECGIILDNIDPDEKIILIHPNETILAHTDELIGGVSRVSTMMKARSSMGRNFIEVCKCASYGNIGYTNRWVMEITNNSRNFTIPLVVGRRIAQIIFFDTEGIRDQSYNTIGKYQDKESIEELKSSWKPHDMIPKLYLEKPPSQKI